MLKLNWLVISSFYICSCNGLAHNDKLCMDVSHKTGSTQLYNYHSITFNKKKLYNIFYTKISHTSYPNALFHYLTKVELDANKSPLPKFLPRSIINLILNHVFSDDDVFILLLMNSKKIRYSKSNPISKLFNSLNKVKVNIQNPYLSNFWIGTMPIKYVKNFQIPMLKLEHTSTRRGAARNNLYMNFFTPYLSNSNLSVEVSLKGSDDTKYSTEIPFKKNEGNLIVFGNNRYNTQISYPIIASTNNKKIKNGVENLVLCYPLDQNIFYDYEYVESSIFLVKFQEDELCKELLFIYNYEKENASLYSKKYSFQRQLPPRFNDNKFVNVSYEDDEDNSLSNGFNNDLSLYKVLHNHKFKKNSCCKIL